MSKTRRSYLRGLGLLEGRQLTYHKIPGLLLIFNLRIIFLLPKGYQRNKEDKEDTFHYFLFFKFNSHFQALFTASSTVYFASQFNNSLAFDALA